MVVHCWLMLVCLWVGLFRAVKDEGGVGGSIGDIGVMEFSGVHSGRCWMGSHLRGVLLGGGVVVVLGLFRGRWWRVGRVGWLELGRWCWCVFMGG